MSTVEPSANNEFLAGFLDDFFAECDEHLTTARRALLALESFVHQPQIDRSLLDELFRSFHSLKGISAMVGVHEVEQLAHQMESYLRALRNHQLILTIEGMDGLVAGTKMIEQVVAAYHERTPLPDIALVLEQLKNLVPETPASGHLYHSVFRLPVQSQKDSTLRRAQNWSPRCKMGCGLGALNLFRQLRSLRAAST